MDDVFRIRFIQLNVFYQRMLGVTVETNFLDIHQALKLQHFMLTKCMFHIKICLHFGYH